MKFVPFLIPFYPNFSKFKKIIKYIKKKKINYLEIGLPNNFSYLDSNLIKKKYKKILKKECIKKILKKLIILFNKIKIKIILVCYYDTILNFKNEKKFFNIINKCKSIKNIIIIDMNLLIFKKIKKFFKKIKPIFLFPFSYNLKKIKKKLKKNSKIYLYLNRKKKEKKKKKISLFFKKNKISTFVGFGIKSKNFKEFNNFDKIVIGTQLIKKVKKFSKFKKEIKKYVKN
ncbi:tryptophan synthase subunit alpha [Candidatus Vidania fulgoroideorum]